MPSLYANLLDPETAKQAVISSEPVKYEFGKKSSDAAPEDKKSDAALRFQPIKRPQASSKQKPRASVPANASHKHVHPIAQKASAVAPLDAGSSLDKWKTSDDQIEDPYAAEYLRYKHEERERAKWAAKKKKKKGQDASRWIDYDQIYDPEYPTRLDEYKGSEEQANAQNDWKARLYAHKLRSKSESPPQQEHNDRPVQAFAPPTGYSFAPPTNIDNESKQFVGSSRLPAFDPPPLPTTSDEPIQATLSLSNPPQTSASSLSSTESTPPPPKAPAPWARASETTTNPSAVMSAAPVRYSAPAPSSDPANDVDQDAQHRGLGHNDPSTTDQNESNASLETDPSSSSAPRSNRPGQKDFAKRLLQKYGWQQGQGLGATGTGITTILRHQTEKRKKRSDAEGGGWVTPSAIGRIVGGKKRKTDSEADDTDTDALTWSIVAVFAGMLKDINVDVALTQGDLMQSIGDKMAEYGVVERLYIDRSGQAQNIEIGQDDTADTAQSQKTQSQTTQGPNVFVKYTSALSAYRAIQAAQNKDFLGNGALTTARFWDADKFEAGVYV